MLRFIALSGTTGVTENCYIYEYNNDMIVVDFGVGFPDPEMFGVDLVIPDFDYLRKNRNKLRAIFITHGHEDHLGALPFLLKEIKAPVYSTKLTSGFIQDKLDDYGVKNYDLRVFDPEKDTISAGVFKVSPFRVSHSVPDAVGFAIDTPEGKLFHVPDYKFDWTPVNHKPFDVKRAAMLASGGCLAVASDSLGATTPGYTESERYIQGRIEVIVRKARERVFFTTVSSNISRIQQALNVAQLVGRKVSFVGRSIDKKSEIAQKLGYLKYPGGLVVDPRRASKMKRNQIMYIISGSYAQPGSSLFRVALGEHKVLRAEEGDTVVFSADPAPPGSKNNVDFIVDKFIEMNVDVHYYDMQEDLHVSGHGSQEDIKMLFSILSPKYYIPIGGTVRHMRAYSLLAQEVGAKPEDVFELMPGESIDYSQGKAKRGPTVPVKDILVDGLGIGDVGNVVLRDRHILAKEGVVIAILQVDRLNKELVGTPGIMSRGFVFEAREKDFLNKTAEKLEKLLRSRKKVDKHSVRSASQDFLERYFYSKLGRRPMVLPVVVEI